MPLAAAHCEPRASGLLRDGPRGASGALGRPRRGDRLGAGDRDRARALRRERGSAHPGASRARQPRPARGRRLRLPRARVLRAARERGRRSGGGRRGDARAQEGARRQSVPPRARLGGGGCPHRLRERHLEVGTRHPSRDRPGASGGARVRALRVQSGVALAVGGHRARRGREHPQRRRAASPPARRLARRGSAGAGKGAQKTRSARRARRVPAAPRVDRARPPGGPARRVLGAADKRRRGRGGGVFRKRRSGGSDERGRRLRTRRRGVRRRTRVFRRLRLGRRRRRRRVFVFARARVLVSVRAKGSSRRRRARVAPRFPGEPRGVTSRRGASRRGGCAVHRARGSGLVESARRLPTRRAEKRSGRGRRGGV